MLPFQFVSRIYSEMMLDIGGLGLIDILHPMEEGA